MKKRKPMAVERVRDPTSGAETAVMYDYEDRDFFAKSPDSLDEVRDVTQRGCVAKARKMLESTRAFDWTAVILVFTNPKISFHSRDEHALGAQILLQYRRCEVATRRTKGRDRKQTESQIERPHLLDLPEDERVPGMQKYPFTSDPNAAARRERGLDITVHWDRDWKTVPYSEATWEALGRLRATLLHAADALEKLVADPARLTAGSLGPLLAEKTQNAEADRGSVRRRNARGGT